jgi:serine/threonine-protein kinase
MTRDDEDQPVDAENEAERVVRAEAETRLLIDEEAAAETVLAEDLPDLPVSSPSASAEPSDSDSADALDDDEDDRTQLVPRSEPQTAADSETPKATRVLDPNAAAAGSNDRSVPDTRVLDESDKTVPPAVGGNVPAATASADRPAPPTPIDPNRGLAPGTVLFGEYEIVNVLGVGGMGEVYRAKHRRLGEYRAIKVMHAELSQKKGASEFFYREAKALLAVRHPAVAHCHDLLSDDAGRVYLIMEMIEGIPLSKKMDDGPLSPDEVAVLGARVSHGLAAAHRKGVIHRDVSPDNIVLPNGRVQEAKLIDFGIAKILEEGEGTIVDGFKGKLSYASPEQLGFFGGKIDGRSDFYSLGLVLVAAALGRPMAMGTTVVEAVDARRGFETLPDAIPIGLRSALQPLLALDPDDRPKYVDRLFVVPGGSESGTDTGRISTGGIVRSADAAGGSRNQIGLIAGAAVLSALLIAGGLFLARGGDSTPDSSRVMMSAVIAETQGAVDPPVIEKPLTPETTAAVPTPTPVVVKKPTPRRLTGSDLLKIRGKLGEASRAVDENRLMSPANNNAYDRYQFVLNLDPKNRVAKAGMRDIAARYTSMADRAIDKGDLGEAQTFIDRARRADAGYPGIAAVEAQLSR